MTKTAVPLDPVRWWVGRISFDSDRQDVMDRLSLAFSRKMRPRRALRQPREKRKKAATRVKSSTW